MDWQKKVMGGTQKREVKKKEGAEAGEMEG